MIIYNSCNWADSSILFSPDEIIYSGGLTCSNVVRLYSCRDPTSFSLGALYGFTLCTYDGTDIVSPEASTEVTTGGNLKGLLLVDWLGSLYGIELGTDVDNVLGFSDGKVLVTKLGALDVLSLGT